MLPKKKILELSKKKIEKELKKQKATLKEQSPVEKAKSAFHTTVKGTSPAEDSKDLGESESPQKPNSKEPKSEVYTPDLSKMIDKSYEKLQRTSRGLAAAASVLLGETLGINTSVESEDSESQAEGGKKDPSTAVTLARKILEQKKREKRNSIE